MGKLKKLFLIGLAGIFVFILLTGIAVAQDDLEVTGITYDEKGGSFAIVNNEIVRVGDKIKEAELIEIREGAVKFKKGGKIFNKIFREGPEIVTDKLGEYSISSGSTTSSSRIFEGYEWGAHIKTIEKQLIQRNKNITVSANTIEYQDKIYNQDCKVLLKFGPLHKLLQGVRITWKNPVCGNLEKELTDKYGHPRKPSKNREVYEWGDGKDSVSLDCASSVTYIHK